MNKPELPTINGCILTKFIGVTKYQQHTGAPCEGPTLSLMAAAFSCGLWSLFGE